MKYFLIPLCIFILSSCYKEKEINQSNLRYLALGDSYTIGEGIKFEYNYPKQIVNQIFLIDTVTVIAKQAGLPMSLLIH